MTSVPSLGTKRICPVCGARFYDLNKHPATCPKCGHSYDPTQPVRARRAKRVTEEAHDDVLVQHMNKAKAPPRAKNPAKAKGAEEEAFEDLDAGGEATEALEELEELDDIEALEELEDIEEEDEEELAEDIALEDDAAAESLIDTVDITEEAVEEEEEDHPPAKLGKPGKSGKKPGKK